MSVSAFELIDLLTACNNELQDCFDSENWQLSTTLIEKRANLVEQLIQVLPKIEKNQQAIATSLLTKIMVSDGEFIAKAIDGQQEISQQLKQIKHGQKAIPAYQACQEKRW